MLESGVDDQTSINTMAQSICTIHEETADTLELEITGELINRKYLENLIRSHGMTLIVKNIENVLQKTGRIYQAWGQSTRYFGTRVPILQYSSVLSTRTFKKYLYSYLYSSTFNEYFNETFFWKTGMYVGI